MSKVQRELVTHTFKGKRFDDHGLDLDVLPDLFAYKQLLVETAKALWRRSHPDRERLPKNFEDGLTLKFFAINKGSAAVPIMREYESEDQADFWKTQPPDELDTAVELVNAAIVAADNNQPLPEELPRNIIPLFGDYGKGLRDDESVELRSERTRTAANYTRNSQRELLARVMIVYTDVVDFTGEVRAVDLGGTFTLKLDDGSKIPGRFSTDQETVVTEALQEHASRRLRVNGIAEFQPSGEIKSIIKIKDLTIQQAGELTFNAKARPVWEVVAELGSQIPAKEWEKVPADAARNLEHYLYGAPKDGK
jgi:hypothetical protein